jgi:hypothetical protein
VSLPARVATLVVAFLAVVAAVVFVVIHYIAAQPTTVNYAPYASNGQVNVVLQTDPQNTVTTKPDWVSYFVQDPATKAWLHTAYFAVPANTKVNVTIYGYDGCTALRNPIFGQVTGTIGDVEYVNGKPVSALNSWSGCNVQHTFSIPGLGLNVPIASPTTYKENQNLCGTSPCEPSGGPHQVVTFSFMTPKAAGGYAWQCRIPCGGGFLDGNGGPMQTEGYMTGVMEVTA